MQKTYYSFLIFLLIFAGVHAKDISNNDIFKSITETLEKEEFLTEKSLDIISNKNNNQKPKVNFFTSNTEIVST
jgi:hypothetical protein